MVEIDVNVLIGTLAGIIGGIGFAIAYVAKLSMRVNHLEKEIETNPILNALKHFEKDFIIREINNFIAKRLEGKND